MSRRIGTRFVAYFAVCWGTLALLANGIAPAGAWMVVALALYTFVPLVVFLRFGGWPFYPGAAFRILVVRVFLYVQVALPFVTAAGILGVVGGLPFGRALSAGRIGAASMMSVVLLVFVIGYLGARQLRIARLTIRIPSLPAGFEGMTIAQICDLHIGPHTNAAFLRRIVRTVTELHPDLIAVPGDLVDDRPEDVPLFTRAFASLSAPLGLFMSPGNHDIYQGWDAISAALRAADIGTLLVNESRLISRGGGRSHDRRHGDPARTDGVQPPSRQTSAARSRASRAAP